jgi:hypothetical protein
MKHLLIMRKTLVSTLCATTLVAAGCGGGGSDSTVSSDTGAGPTVVSRGAITGFGSVYVNGVRYITDDTQFEVDDKNGDQSDLKIGMIVTVKGRIGENGEGTADSIIYDNELKGPVSVVTPDGSDPSRQTLTILGQSVLVNADTTIDDDGGLTFDTIAVGDILEVSGYITDTGFTATHIELQDPGSKIRSRVISKS